MKYLSLALCLAVIAGQLIAEEEVPSENFVLYFELGEISAPYSFYTEDWDPTQKLLPILPWGQLVEEKDLIVDLDQAVREAREQQDQLRSQRSWLYESNVGSIRIESGEGFYEENGDDD